MSNQNVVRISLDKYLKPFLACSAIIRIYRAEPIEEHAINVFHIHYMHKGRESWILKDGTVLRISGGQIGILQPNVYHGCEMNVMYPERILSLSLAPQAPGSMPIFSNEQAVKLIDIFRRAGNCVIQAPDKLEGLYLSLNDLISKEKRSLVDELHISLVLAEVVVTIAKACIKTPATSLNMAVEKAKRTIEQNPNKDIKVSEIVRNSGLQSSHFFRQFRKQTGYTPAEYRLWLRCELGKKMLKDPGAPIVDIANTLNFSSSQHFSTCFKAHFGVTPSEFKKQIKSLSGHKRDRRSPDDDSLNIS